MDYSFLLTKLLLICWLATIAQSSNYFTQYYDGKKQKIYQENQTQDDIMNDEIIRTSFQNKIEKIEYEQNFDEMDLQRAFPFQKENHFYGDLMAYDIELAKKTQELDDEKFARELNEELNREDEAQISNEFQFEPNVEYDEEYFALVQSQRRKTECPFCIQYIIYQLENNNICLNMLLILGFIAIIFLIFISWAPEFLK